MRHSNKERDNVAESRPGSNTGPLILSDILTGLNPNPYSNHQPPTLIFENSSLLLFMKELQSCTAPKT